MFWKADDDDEYGVEYELSHEEREINYESKEPYQVLLIIERSFGISKRWIATTLKCERQLEEASVSPKFPLPFSHCFPDT